MQNNNKNQRGPKQNPHNKHNNNHKKKLPRVPNDRADPFGNAKSMQLYAKKIIKDIAFGSFDIGARGEIFTDFTFINAAVIMSADELHKALIHKYAIECAFNGSNDVYVKIIYDDDCRKAGAWQLVYDCMVMIQQTGDPGYLLALANKLPAHKHNL